jgi:hypothetical protein
MKVFVPLLLILTTVGCTCPRYDVRVASVPSVGRADWVVVRVDRQTGQVWYSYHKAVDMDSAKPVWQSLDGVTEGKK